jgi:hypothetical protein
VIRPGEEWGEPTAQPADAVVEGGDATLARWVNETSGGLVQFLPSSDSDIARAVGLSSPAAEMHATHEVPLDVLRFANGHSGLAVNMVVLGVAPDRLRRGAQRTKVRVEVDGRVWFDDTATTVVVATGEYLRGLDVSPRGHPGDGRAEVQVYAVRTGERRAMRGRLATGTHVPHPRIAQRTGRAVSVRTTDPLPLEVDGRLLGMTNGLAVEVLAGAYRLLL